MNIGIDIDGVIADQAKGVLQVINKAYGTCYTIDMWDSWIYASDIVGSVSLLLKMMEEAWQLGYVKPVEFDIAATIKRIKKIGRVSIISKRTYGSHVYVVQALQDWGIKYDNLILLSGDEEKLNYPIDILIDDHPTVDHPFYETRIPILLRDQPWNQGIKAGQYPRLTHITRIFSLIEAIPLLKEYKRCQTIPQRLVV